MLSIWDLALSGVKGLEGGKKQLATAMHGEANEWAQDYTKKTPVGLRIHVAPYWSLHVYFVR